MFRVAGFEKESTVDGEGWRFVIFFQGCSHKCLGCHNPETWEFNCGTEMEDEDILNILEEQDPVGFLDITLSGGDPFFQAEHIISLAKKLRNTGRSIWAYTGFKVDDFIKFKNGEKCDPRVNNYMLELLNYIDVLVDGRFEIDRKTLELPYVGSSNQRIINVKATIEKNIVVLYE